MTHPLKDAIAWAREAAAQVVEREFRLMSPIAQAVRRGDWQRNPEWRPETNNLLELLGAYEASIEHAAEQWEALEVVRRRESHAANGDEWIYYDAHPHRGEPTQTILVPAQKPDPQAELIAAAEGVLDHYVTSEPMTRLRAAVAKVKGVRGDTT